MEHLENIHPVSEEAHQTNTALSWVFPQASYALKYELSGNSFQATLGFSSL